MNKNNLSLVSIGIPTYNRVDYLIDTLNSLLNQTYKNIEIIVSDNASTDATKEIVSQYAKKNKKIKYFYHPKHIPAINNFNFVLSKSNGEYFMWAADDDLWNKSFIAETVNTFTKNDDAVLVATKFAVMDNDGVIRKNKKCSFSEFKNDIIDFKTYLKEDFYHFKANIFYGMYRTGILKKIGGYNPLPVLAASDCLTVHRIMAEGKVMVVNRTLFFKRENFFNIPAKMRRIDYLLIIFSAAQSIIKIIYVSIKNILPENFFYIYKNVSIYFRYNNELIQKHYPKNKIILFYYNILSSISLFTALFPNDTKALKKRNMIFSGRLK